MSFLIRKINKAKWNQNKLDESYEVTADVITNCLKTTKNTLSVWKIEAESDLDQAILALISNQDHLDAIDIVILEEKILKRELIINETPGNTTISSLIHSHRDIANLTYTQLGIVKNHIIDKFRQNQIKRFTKTDLIKILKRHIDLGVLKEEDLKESVRKKLR